MSNAIGPEEVRSLYEQHSHALLMYACSFLNSRASAEDALHQVFERLLRGGIEIEGAAVSYLYRAIRNAALNQIRGRTREARLDDRWLHGQPGMNGTALELQSVLRGLSQEQKEIIVLHIWAEMTFDEIAAALEISPSTVASRYRYGLAKLREQFQVAARKTHG